MSHDYDDDPLAVGDTVLDRYRVEERLEEGGTSVVYRGEDERLSRPVCIKVFQGLRGKEWTHRTTYEHFVQEAFALSRLTHPNTLRIYDFAHLPLADGAAPSEQEPHGPPFQVSEFMNGGTLSDWVRQEGSLSASQTLPVVSAICGALDEAHEQGIVHRDIKPKNILFGTTGASRAPKLADFGIAKSLLPEGGIVNQAGDTRIVSGRRLLMFSGLWAAPEQLRGAPVSACTDVYSFGLVVLYMLTGQCPFTVSRPRDALDERARANELIDEIVDGTDLPPAVVAVLKRACATDASERPQSAGELADALADAFHTESPRRMPLRDPTPLAPVPGLVDDDDDNEATVSSAPPRRLALSDGAQSINDRMARLVALDRDAAVDMPCLSGRARLRVSLVPSREGKTLHVRGLSCFIRKVGGRSSRAVQLTDSMVLELVAANQEVLGQVAVDFGKPAAGHRVFKIGTQSIAIGTEDCPTVIGFDFGPGNEALFACALGAGARAAIAVQPHGSS